MNRQAIYMKALETWGEELQITVLFEEMAELQKEFCKHLRGTTTFENIADEIADVEIMLEQMKLLFELDEAVVKQKEYKINRLAKRLKMEDLI